MKKLLAIMVLGLLFSGTAYAKKIHDANEDGILITECVFGWGGCYRQAADHCAQFKKFFVHVYNHQAEKDFTVRLYCVTEVGKYFYEPLLKKQLEVQKTNFDPNSPWATKSKVSANSSTSGTSTSDKIADAKQACKELGFKPKSEKFADCALKLVTLDFERTTNAKNEPQVIINKNVSDTNIFDELGVLFRQQGIIQDTSRPANTRNNIRCTSTTTKFGQVITNCR
jgi:hypothetical protein